MLTISPVRLGLRSGVDEGDDDFTEAIGLHIDADVRIVPKV